MFGQYHLHRESEVIVLAQPDEIVKLNGLIDKLNVDEDIVGKWLAKAKVDRVEDMKQTDIEKCIEHLTKIAEEAITV